MGFFVFLGLVFIGLIVLYLKTRAVWNWKKIALWFFGGIFFLFFAIYIYSQSDSIGAWFARQMPAKEYKSLAGITIGDDLSDIEFKKGKLDSIEFGDKDADIPYFVDEYASIYVDKKTKKVLSITLKCGYSSSYDFSTNGIRCGDSGEDLRDRYGKELQVLCTSGGWESVGDPARAFDVAKYGIRYILEKDKVRYINVMSKEEMASRKYWEPCKK